MILWIIQFVFNSWAQLSTLISYKRNAHTHTNIHTHSTHTNTCIQMHPHIYMLSLRKSSEGNSMAFLVTHTWNTVSAGFFLSPVHTNQFVHFTRIYCSSFSVSSQSTGEERDTGAWRKQDGVVARTRCDTQLTQSPAGQWVRESFSWRRRCLTWIEN